MRGRTWRALAWVPLAAVLSSCGTTATAPSVPTAHIIVVGQAEAGRTIQATIGDTIEVSLQELFPVPGSSLVWDVTSNEPAVLTPGKVTRDPAQRPVTGSVTYTADFTAVSAGEGQLLARGSRTCEAMLVCPPLSLTITVEVSPSA